MTNLHDARRGTTKTRSFSLLVFSLALPLVVLLVFHVQSNRAQEPGSTGASQGSFDPTGLQRGRPLPAAGYPPKRVRSAPADWAPEAPPDGIDLDVTYVNRAPMYQAYCVQYPDGVPALCPGTEGEKRWPALGEVVTFTAHVVNKGTLTSPDLAYKWFVDGAEVASGTHPGLAPGAEGTVTYPWAWAHTMDGERVVDDHSVRFTVDPDDVIVETYETNNSLEDRTNALGFRIAITPEMYQAYNTPWDPVFSYSAEDWLQRQIAAMNWDLANSIYETTPQGATERVRINWIEVTPTSPINDGRSDGGWFVDADYRLVSGGYDPVADVDWNLVHELSHQVGLIDLYNLNTAVTSVEVQDGEGLPANFGFTWPRPGLMGGGDIAPHTNPHLYSSHSARGISSTKGYRRGYYGEYQFDVPEQNYLRILDSQGDPVSDVTVNLYQRTSPPDWSGGLSIDNTPEISGTTGPDGLLLIPNRSAGGGTTTRTGHTLHDNPFGIVDVVGPKNLFLLKLGKGDHQEFIWLDITAFNFAYWQGHTISHTFTLTSHVPPPDAPVRPGAPSARVQDGLAILCWDASPSAGVSGYYVYRAAPPTFTYERVSDLVTELRYAETVIAGNRVYAITAVDSSGRESGFSDFIWAPRLMNPFAVGITSAGTRVVLDPQNGYALLRQRSDGRFIQNFGSPHYHLEYSYFLAIDSQDHLLFSHPGDYYTSRHSVRVADRDANPLLEFGERGSGPGQFRTPSGVAVWGQPCSIEGPHPVDAHTLLLLHLNGTYGGAQGETGTSSGTSFAVGKYDQGVTIDGDDTLSYATAGNLNRTQGAIEFWVRPNWDGGDGQSYTFFEAGNRWFNRMRIMKDGANNLRFMLWDSSTEYGIAYNVAHWQAGDWHHVGVTWEGARIALFVDGKGQASSAAANPPDALADTMYVGVSLWHDQQANATLDELRVSDVPRIGNSDTCTYRILVADSGNHRIQAFDQVGNFVSAYGGSGSGDGQFDYPQGLAVDGSGRVIVADSGNDRLQILSFDGANFDAIQSITADFDGPTGVAAYGDARIIVADTGNDVVKTLDAEGALLAEYTAASDAYGGMFNQPRGVIGDCNGDILVADTGNERLVTIVDVLPPLASFTASPTFGDAPLQVVFTNTSCGNYTASLWEFGDGLTDTLESPTHTYTAVGAFDVTLTVSGPTGSGTGTQAKFIIVLGEYDVYLPLVLRDA